MSWYGNTADFAAVDYADVSVSVVDYSEVVVAFVLNHPTMNRIVIYSRLKICKFQVNLSYCKRSNSLSFVKYLSKTYVDVVTVMPPADVFSCHSLRDFDAADDEVCSFVP